MATNDQVQSLYIAYFGRPADTEGLKDWTADESTPLATIADGFAGTDEYKASIKGESAAQVINSFYVNLFGRSVEVKGLNDWLDALAKGDTTLQQIGVVIGQAAVNAVPANSDTTAIKSKFAAANQWTSETAKTTEGIIAYGGVEGIEAGINFLTPVTTTATIPSEAATTAAVSTLINANSGANVSTLELTALQDLVTSTGYTQLSGTGSVVSSSKFEFNAQNQTINAVANTFSGVLNAADVLQDNFTNDADVLNITGITGVTANTLGHSANNTAATVQNIETVNLTLGSAATSSFNVGNNPGNNANVTVNYNGSTTLNIGGTLGAGAVFTATNAVAGNAFATLNAAAVTGAAANNGASVVLTGDNTVETITGSTALANILNGAGGNDTIIGGNAGDTITAGVGNDTVTGNGGSDIFAMTTGQGIDDLTDLLLVVAATSSVTPVQPVVQSQRPLRLSLLVLPLELVLTLPCARQRRWSEQLC